jgi:membrane-associated protease RseP (regulator of RpoE activity)
MTGTLGVVGILVALIVVIVIHEAAHFGMAKRFGIKVEEFFVGFGPRIWSTWRGETEYGFKWIPAGGYVKIAGMNPYQPAPPEDLPRTFGAKPIWQRSLVIFAGPATHFVLAFVCFALWVGLVGEPRFVEPVFREVPRTLDGAPSPAYEAGFRAGDRVVAIEGTSEPTMDGFVASTKAHVGQPITITVERDGGTYTADVVPVLSTVEGEQIARIGVVLGDTRVVRDTTGPAGAITGGATLVWDASVQTVVSIGNIFGPEGIRRVAELLFTDAPREVSDPRSILGIGRAAGETATGEDAGDLLYLFGFINVFIGLLNLLPLPPFDGGHLAMLAIEKVRGRQVDMRKVVPVSVAVAAFFIVFTVSIIYLDVVKPGSLAP